MSSAKPTPTQSTAPDLILPKGTRVVTRIPTPCFRSGVIKPAGAVGTITKIPLDGSHSYVVEFPDLEQASAKRACFSILKHSSDEDLGERLSLDAEDLQPYVIYRCVVGSRAYGLETEGSDTDVRGIYLPPAQLEWSLYGVPEQLEDAHAQECFWELRKFLIMALKANPNILECLHTPIIQYASPLAEELLSIREIFLSKLLYKTYNGYVLSQFKKLEQDLRTNGEIKWKHAMHLIRLLWSGVTALESGVVPVQVGLHREELLRIKHGS